MEGNNQIKYQINTAHFVSSTVKYFFYIECRDSDCPPATLSMSATSNCNVVSKGLEQSALRGDNPQGDSLRLSPRRLQYCKLDCTVLYCTLDCTVHCASSPAGPGTATAFWLSPAGAV